MQFRKNLFMVLAVLSLLWVCGGVSLSQSAANDVSLTPAATIEGMNQRTANDFRNLGASIGGGLGMTFFACTGLPLALIFGLLAWRNSVGLTNERRHQEQLAVQSQQFDAMRQMATAQTAQAQMQFASFAPQVQPASLPSSDTDVQAKFKTARELIEDKEYNAARAILRKIDDPKAHDWLEKIDKLDPH